MMPDLQWWQQLTPPWKKAFAETFFRHQHEPTPGELAQLYASPALRLAGPTAPYPNMSFELEDLSGVTALQNLEILVVSHHLLTAVTELRSLHRLRSLFLFNNRIESLEGIEDLTTLEQLYVQCNRIGSIKPVAKLTSLKEVYVHDNALESLEGLTEEHAEKLEVFFCKPNENLSKKEVFRMERELGIRCRSL